MDIFKTTAQAVMKRPLILIPVGVLMLLAAIVNAFIPVMAMIMGIVNMTGGNIFESVLSVLQMLIDPGIIPTLLILLAVLAILAAIVAGLVLPGYLMVIDDGITVGPKKRGLFVKGLKYYFFKFFLMTVKTMLFTAFLAVFLMIATIPAVIVTRAALTTKPDLMIAALFVDFVTVGILFMCLSFFKAYIYMWYIAAVKGRGKPFLAGKEAADTKFWGMALSLLVFDVIFAAGIFLIYLSTSQLFRYIAGWIFTTALFTTLAVYLVNVYRDYSENK